MSNIGAVHTQIAKNSSGSAPQGLSKAADKNNPFLQARGVNFFDLLITKVTQEQSAPPDDQDLTLDLTGEDAAATLDGDGLKTLKEALDSLIQGLPADQRSVAIKLNPGQVQKILQKLTADAGNINSKQQALIATGLTPEQLTKLSDLMANGNAQAIDDSDLKAIIVSILKLVPDTDKAGAVFFPKALMAGKDDKIKNEASDKDDDKDIESSLTALICGAAPLVTPPAGETADPGLNSNGLKKAAGGFNEVLKILEQLQSKSGPDATPPLPGAEKTADAAAKPGPVNSTAGADFGALLGSLTSGDSLDGMFPDGLNWSKDNQYGLAPLQAGGPAQLTSLVTQAPAAAQAHPATQVVIATMVKTAQGGETKSMTLQLDPAELGKIEIHMQFTRDKSVKTHMVFEKPETMLMMQRDSRALEYAMQNAGMNGSETGLSFELASHDHDFSGGNGGDTGCNRGQKTGTENAMVIETTIAWPVDAHTGLQHYNVLV